MAEKQSEASNPFPLRIILADDNPLDRMIARRVLKALGYSGDEVCNGVELLHAVRTQKYDVVLTDVQMPEMGGLEATRQIHGYYPPEERPFIIGVTSENTGSDRQLGLAAGMNVYLTKPLQREELAIALSQVMQPQTLNA
ncbi:response regulator [Spirulina subsalsa FACHB-351]|uniref:Response regulator n=1 Tax=Spirulina subsalsa FACHB-351 TaxID=234711 RepID=A0ABT3L839_9CYAN|nr:response regulator [Spirulina subsalsa]MCW6037332.1 response regulator [Spirulina subsalsa FACHB-351]